MLSCRHPAASRLHTTRLGGHPNLTHQQPNRESRGVIHFAAFRGRAHTVWSLPLQPWAGNCGNEDDAWQTV